MVPASPRLVAPGPPQPAGQSGAPARPIRTAPAAPLHLHRCTDRTATARRPRSLIHSRGRAVRGGARGLPARAAAEPAGPAHSGALAASAESPRCPPPRPGPATLPTPPPPGPRWTRRPPPLQPPPPARLTARSAPSQLPGRGRKEGCARRARTRHSDPWRRKGVGTSPAPPSLPCATHAPLTPGPLRGPRCSRI